MPSRSTPGGEFKDRFRFRFYESRHVMYLRKPDLEHATNDLRDFLRWCLEDLPVRPLHAK